MATPNSFTVFKDITGNGYNEPTMANLYSVEFGLPAIIGFLPGFEVDVQSWYNHMNYFSDAVSIPSRNITTGDIKNIGIGRKYATGQTENQLTISFMLTKSSWHRNFFEKWMQKIAPDSENRVGFYDDYTTDIYVRKWERGSNYLNHVKQGGKDYFSRMNKAVGIYHFTKCFPVNMAGLEFSNDGNGILKMNMLFNYERYRFTTKVQKPKDWTEDKVITENLDVAQALGLGTDTNTQFGI